MSVWIYPETCQTGYGRFRPNKSDHHSSCRCYRGGWHRSYPALIPGAFYTPEKPLPKQGHLGSPRHAFAHCGVFAPAAPRRAWTHVSESISRLLLSQPVPILSLVGRYPTNYLIGRRLILGRSTGLLSVEDPSRPFHLLGIIPSFPGLSPTRG